MRTTGLNLALSGGASNGLAYARMWKEIENENISFDVVSASSVGAVMGVPIMSGMPVSCGKEVLKALRGDKYMAYNKKIEEAPWYKKPFMLLKWIFHLRKEFYKSCESILKFYFANWDSVSYRCRKMYLSCVKMSDVKKYLIADIANDFGDGELGFKLDLDVKEVIKKVPVYYFSDDGVYKYQNEVLLKLSTEVIPLWKAVLASFNNPLLPKVKVRLEQGKPERVVDGGLIDNFAVGPQLLMDYWSIACVSQRMNQYPSGIMGCSYELFRENPPSDTRRVAPTKERQFFDFSDEAIEEEFSRKPTRMFKKELLCLEK